MGSGHPLFLKKGCTHCNPPGVTVTKIMLALSVYLHDVVQSEA
jgi:hypothetical protein